MNARNRYGALVVGVIAVLVVMFAAGRYMSAPRVGEWMTDLEAAKVRAGKEGKALLVQFTGDAWCPYCKMLKARVLSSAAFGAATRDVVMVYLDYPTPGEPTPAMVQANPGLTKLMALKAAHGIDGFPTVVTYDSKGTELARIVGYGMEPAKEYIGRLNLPKR